MQFKMTLKTYQKCNNTVLFLVANIKVIQEESIYIFITIEAHVLTLNIIDILKKFYLLRCFWIIWIFIRMIFKC